MHGTFLTLIVTHVELYVHMSSFIQHVMTNLLTTFHPFGQQINLSVTTFLQHLHLEFILVNRYLEHA